MKIDRIAVKAKLEEIKELIITHSQMQAEEFVILQRIQVQIARMQRHIHILYGRKQIQQLKKEEKMYHKLMDDHNEIISKLLNLRKLYRKEARAFQDKNGDDTTFDDDL